MESIILWFTRFPNSSQRRQRWFYTAWLLGLMALGGLAWGLFINYGKGPFTFHDWAEVTAPRLAVVQDAVRDGVLPFHINDPYPLGGLTDRFLTIPDVILSPQMILLNWMEVGPFILFNTLLLYAAGFAGLVVIAIRKQLSPLVFSLLFVLFNFNGHLLAHVSAGHYTWTACFLLPWLAPLLFDLLEDKTGWPWILKVSVWMFILLLQGGYHHFIYTLILLGLLGLTHMRRLIQAGLAALASVLLGAVRLLPLFLSLNDFGDKTTYYGGFGSLDQFWDGLTRLQLPLQSNPPAGLSQPIGTWENNVYLGLGGTLFILLFGLIFSLVNRKKPGSLAYLLLPAAGMTALTLERVFYYLRLVLPLPIFTGERVASRLAVMIIFVLLLAAVVEFQRWLNEQHPSPVTLFAGIILAVIVVHDLWQNFLVWMTANAAPVFLAQREFDFYAPYWQVSNRPDPSYQMVLWIGLAISLITAGVLIFGRFRLNRKN